MTGFGFPYRIGTDGRTGFDPDRHIRGMIELVLFTNQGERVNRPDFGANVPQLVFSENSPELATALQHLVMSALQRWLGERIEIRGVEVEARCRDARRAGPLPTARRRGGAGRACGAGGVTPMRLQQHCGTADRTPPGARQRRAAQRHRLSRGPGRRRAVQGAAPAHPGSGLPEARRRAGRRRHAVGGAGACRDRGRRAGARHPGHRRRAGRRRPEPAADPRPGRRLLDLPAVAGRRRRRGRAVRRHGPGAVRTRLLVQGGLRHPVRLRRAARRGP